MSLRALLGLAPLLLLACGDDTCNREGCDALQGRAAEEKGQTRVAGVVAYLSDVVANGCQECGLAEQATVGAWSLAEPVKDQAEIPAITAEAPDATAQVTAGSYNLALSAGPHLVCVSNGCFNVTAVAERTTTLNVRLVFGVPRGFIGEADTKGLTEVNAFPSFP